MGQVLQSTLCIVSIGYVAKQGSEHRLPGLEPHGEREIDGELPTIRVLGDDLDPVASKPCFPRACRSCQAGIMSRAVFWRDDQGERSAQYLRFGEPEKLFSSRIPGNDKVV